MPLECLESVRPYGRRTAFALAAVLFLALGSNWAYSQDASTEGSTESTSSGSASGSNSSSAGQNSEVGGSSETSGSSGSASTSAEGSANAGQQSGSANTAAEADTSTNAQANTDGDTFHASSTATASASGSGNNPPVGVGYAAEAGEITANADATFGGGAPGTANASTVNEYGVTTTSASAVHGLDATATGDTTRTKTGSKKTVAIGVNYDGTYSVAITTRKSSVAYSGIGDYDTFAGGSIQAAARAAVAAYAKATGTYAEAGARATSRGSSSSSGGGYDPAYNSTARDLGGYGNGWASAWSNSKSFARVQINPKAPAQQVASVLASCEWRPLEQLLYCRKFK